MVSGTSLQTKIAAMIHIVPYRPYVKACPKFSIDPRLMLYIGRKVDDTMKLKIHWNATAIATAAPRIVFGKISEMSTQQIGPQLNMKDAL